MDETLLSQRDAYELADILNSKGIDKFCEMAENIARNQTIEEAVKIAESTDEMPGWVSVQELKALKKEE